jgi:hypothetical protein
MVETSVKRRRARSRPWLSVILALLAVAFIVAMVLTGSLPETRQLAKFEAKGVLKVPPEHVRRVELRVGEDAATFVRASDKAWVQSGRQGVLTGELLEHLTEAILLMHTSGPVRVMRRDEYHGTLLQEFGLDRPRYSVALFDGQRLLLEVSFGGHNPQDLLQYMQLKASDDIYLMSRFVGQAWEHLWEHVMDESVSRHRGECQRNSWRSSRC